MVDWYDGQYRIIEAKRLSQRPRPGRGEIIVHDSGAIVLRCPACSALQFTHAKVFDSPDAPSLDRAIQCGSGHCHRCGVWFTIHRGRAKKVEPSQDEAPGPGGELKRAGVKSPPHV